MVLLSTSLCCCTMGEEAALGGPILSGTGLSGSDRDERESNLL